MCGRAVYIAAENGSTEALRVLLNSRGDANQPMPDGPCFFYRGQRWTRGGETPVFIAAAQNNAGYNAIPNPDANANLTLTQRFSKSVLNPNPNPTSRCIASPPESQGKCESFYQPRDESFLYCNGEQQLCYSTNSTRKRRPSFGYNPVKCNEPTEA